MQDDACYKKDSSFLKTGRRTVGRGGVPEFWTGCKNFTARQGNKKTPLGERKKCPRRRKNMGAGEKGGCGEKLSLEVCSFRDGDLWSSSQGKGVR